MRKILKRLSLEKVLDAVDITAAKMPNAHGAAERYFFKVCWNMIRTLEASPPTATVQEDERAPLESGVFEQVEADGEWFACSPGVNDHGEPNNYPEGWDWKTRGDPPELCLTSPVQSQRYSAWHDAYERRKADPDAGEEPKPFLNDSPHEPGIRNPEWVRYWRKYGYSQAREYIREKWGPEGVGNYPCVRRPRIEEKMSPAECARVGNAFIEKLQAGAREGTPLRVGSIEWHALYEVVDQEDIFLDEATAIIGMRVWLDDEVIACIEAVCEDGYDLVAYYASVDEWTPPGMSLVAYQESKHRTG